MSPTLTFFSPCPRGLEPLLADEIREQGGQTVQPISGGVQWQGSLRACYQVNLSSRLASRVLLRIATSPYRDEASLYQAAHAIDWPQWFSVERTLRVDVTAVRSPLNSVDFALLRIKDAICDRFRDACGERPSVDRVIDARGKYVMPGGIDGHTHLDMPFGGTTSSDDFETVLYRHIR